MPQYFVEWIINVDAENPEEEARKALATQRDPKSLATVFLVHALGGDEIEIDLDELDAAAAEAASQALEG